MSLRCRLVPVFVPFLLCGCSYQWRDYSSMEGSFTCRMPGPVKVETKTLYIPGGKLIMDFHGVEVYNGVFMVAYAKLPFKNAPFDYRACVKAMVRVWKGEIIYSKRGPTCDGISGVEFEAKVTWPKNGYAAGRVFKANNRIYQVLVMGSNFRADSPEVKEFWNSFKLLKS